MDNWTVILIIVLVLGVIASNLALLKHSAKFKFPQELQKKDSRNHSDKEEDQGVR